jgi:type III pantothenate kinase
MMILCDIGNSTFHFLKIKKNGKSKSFKLDLESDLTKLRFKTKLYFISVNEKATKKLLKVFPKAINLNDKFILDTNYSSTLGIDRIVASTGIKNRIIVDFGSAITVDIIKNKKHLGGFIMSGFDILKQNYPKISPKLAFDFNPKQNLDKIPTNTNEAINYAIFSMVILPIKEIQKRYNLKIIFTGENSKLVLNYFENYKFKPNLIFKNMRKIIEDLK